MEVRAVTQDNDQLPIIRELYETISSSCRSQKIIQIVQIPQNENRIATYDDKANDTLEIGISKPTYLAMFKQSHDYWYRYTESSQCTLDKIEITILRELYLMTLGYLITANDHHSIMNLHELIVQILGNFEADIEIISCFLTSRLKRINKSSLLWHWMKKMTILVIFNKLEEKQGSQYLSDSQFYNKIVSRAFRSCELHYMNYYANNFIHWIIQFNMIVLGIEDGDYLFHQLQKHCRQALLDSSLWMNMKNYIKCIQGSVQHDNQIIEEYNRINLSYGVPLRIHSKKQLISPNKSDEDIIVGEFQWLVKVQCKNVAPFSNLIELAQTKTVLKRLNELIQLHGFKHNAAKIESLIELRSRMIG